MKSPPRIDELMNELHDAQAAGVFRRTALPAESLFDAHATANNSKKRIPIAAWGAIAATILITVTVWGLMFSSQLSKLERGSNSGASIASVEVISQCLVGPIPSKSHPCASFDYDSDGDVDLADFSRHQVAAIGVIRHQ